jgi:hypothetical protein
MDRRGTSPSLSTSGRLVKAPLSAQAFKVGMSKGYHLEQGRLVNIDGSFRHCVTNQCSPCDGGIQEGPSHDGGLVQEAQSVLVQ